MMRAASNAATIRKKNLRTPPPCAPRPSSTPTRTIRSDPPVFHRRGLRVSAESAGHKRQTGANLLAPPSSAASLRREDAPLVGHALQLMRASIFEADTRTCDEVLDRARHEHLAGVGARRDPRAYVHREPTDTRAHDLALAGVKPRTYLQSDGTDRVSD